MRVIRITQSSIWLREHGCASARSLQMWICVSVLRHVWSAQHTPRNKELTHASRNSHRESRSRRGQLRQPRAGCARRGVVNGADLSVLLGQFGDPVTPGTGADFNASGEVNGADLSVLLGQFGNSCD